MMLSTDEVIERMKWRNIWRDGCWRPFVEAFHRLRPPSRWVEQEILAYLFCSGSPRLCGSVFEAIPSAIGFRRFGRIVRRLKRRGWVVVDATGLGYTVSGPAAISLFITQNGIAEITGTNVEQIQQKGAAAWRRQ